LLIQVGGVFKDNVLGRGGRGRAEEGRGKREEGRGKREGEMGKGIPLASRSCAQV